jgi:YHYH protein
MEISMAGKELPPIPATIPQQQNGYSMLPQSKMKKKLPYTWLTFLFLIVLAIIAVCVAYTLGAKKGIGHPLMYQEQTNQQTPISPAQSTTGTSLTAPTLAAAQTINIHAIPLGDGNISTSPKVGYIYSCQTQFKTGGASHTGDWINGDTWDLTKKISVEGSVSWPNAQLSVTTSGTNRIITGNGLPVDTETGTFPIASTDPAYQIDRNPNSIKAQNISLTLPLDPQMAATPSCVPMGRIGVAINGVSIFNGLDDSGRDAVAHEVQDKCDGHPEEDGTYHYHGPSSCIPEEKEDNKLIGYALDGYGIYSMYDASGKEYTDADLDACHGITSPIMWNGKMVNMYHYVLTQEYPYTIGCFRGSVVDRQKPQGGGQGQTGMQGPVGNHPPLMHPMQGRQLPPTQQ